MKLTFDGLSSQNLQKLYPITVLRPTELQSKIERYNSAFETYQIESNRRQPFNEEYNRQVHEHKQAEEKAAKSWAKENNIRIARSNSGKSIKKDWLKRLKNKGFKFAIPKPVKPFPKKLSQPLKVEYPDRNYLVTWETYLPGSLPEVEKVLEWTRTILGYNVNSWDINEDFVCFEFDEALAEYILERLKPDVLAIFKDILTGNLTTKEAHKQLTSFEIDFEETIGMRHWYSYGRACQGDYSKWHEINLSPTGTWLIEFQSTINPNITFHSPYSRDFGLDKTSLPKVDSTQKNFGREINREEKKNYPIEELIKILGFEAVYFFCELRQYKPQRTSRNYDYNWEEDYNREDDEDFF